MSNQNMHADSLSNAEFDKPKLPMGLNVLTILTFIGSAIQVILGAVGYFGAESNYNNKDKLMAQMNSGEMPNWAKSMMPDPANYEEMVTKSFENRLPIFLLTLVAAGLCFYGALQMRKLKKQGYTIYVIGELLPFVTSVLFLGMFAFTGAMFAVGVGLVVLFILLYTMQRKHLIY